MRSLFLACALALLASTPASADQSCSTSNNLGATATFTVAIQQGTNLNTVSPTVINNFLNLAECQCDSRDVFLKALVTKTFQNGVPSQSVWEGSACSGLNSSRITTCAQVNDDAISVGCFQSGNNCGAPLQRVHVAALVNPLGSAGTACPGGQVSNSVFILWYNNIDSPDYCQIPLTYEGTPPIAPTGVAAGSGDTAVTVVWTPPPQGTTYRPQYYQVLCADENFDPIPGAGAYGFGETQTGHPLGYSVCADPMSHTIQRQALATAGSNTGTDAGTTSTDMAGGFAAGTPESATGGGLSSQGDPVLRPQGDPADAGAVDAGAPATCKPIGSFDGGQTIDTVFPHLDKKYVCTDKLGADTSSVRISGLTNNKTYYFAVVAIDSWGNATPTDPVCGIPQPVEDLYRRFLADGGKPQGFCFIATAAFGSYQDPFVMVLRDFRDEVLLPTGAGQRFVDWYYRVSPPLADAIRDRGWARFLVRTALWPVILAAGLWMWTSPAEVVLLAGLVLALVFSRLLGRARRRAVVPRPTSAPLAEAGSAA